MASETDDNPFARNSAWPKMPQAPFRVGPLPKSGAAPPGPPTAEQPPAEPEPRTITPLFTRPQAAPGANFALGGAAPRLSPTPAPIPAPAPEIRPAVPTPAAVAPQPAPQPAPAPRLIAEAPAERTAVELSELVVTPLQEGRTRPARRRSRLPAIAATAVGVAAMAGLAYLFTRAGPPAPGPPTAAPAAAAVAAAPVTPAPVPPIAAEGPPAAPTPVRTAAAQPARPPPARGTALSAEPEVRIVRLPSDAARATEEAISAPVLVLPVAPAAPPPLAPERDLRPPAAADPNAPIRTQRPY
ncbi:hypothetical protein [uncultured Phenylobacterium sp.]|uniref:hypothetical protein n=1 Tax=uncultured Phenylobacterium sp. TaxID=349273 RepID=UPI0025D42058|nr:hypothetical protein [uncultured Phenylobacterium sp.]